MSIATSHLMIIGGVALAALLTGCETLNDGGLVETPTYAEASISRAQVLAELKEAQRLGLIPLGEGDIPEMTADQVRLIAVAGEKAAAGEKVAQR